MTKNTVEFAIHLYKIRGNYEIMESSNSVTVYFYDVKWFHFLRRRRIDSLRKYFYDGRLPVGVKIYFVALPEYKHAPPAPPPPPLSPTMEYTTVRVSHELTQLDIDRSKFYPEKYFHDMLSAKMTEALRPHIKFYEQENSAGATVVSAEVCVLKK